MKKNNILCRRLFLLFILQVCCTVALQAQTDTVYPGSRHLNTKYLQPGLRQYLVYHQWPKYPKLLMCSYWMRDIRLTQKDGAEVFAISQHWYSGDTSRYWTFFSLNSAKDFAPVYHTGTGNGKTAAYNWSVARITGADTVAGNDKAGFELAFDRPNFNWHLDIETFEMLPLTEGKTFVINFYDAGLEPPKFVAYTVTGSEMLRTLDKRQVDCWILSHIGTDPKGTPFSQTFWISKKEHELLKEEDSFDGRYRYKIKLPGLTPDILQQFTLSDNIHP